MAAVLLLLVPYMVFGGYVARKNINKDLSFTPYTLRFVIITILWPAALVVFTLAELS